MCYKKILLRHTSGNELWENNKHVYSNEDYYSVRNWFSSSRGAWCFTVPRNKPSPSQMSRKNDGRQGLIVRSTMSVKFYRTYRRYSTSTYNHIYSRCVVAWVISTMVNFSRHIIPSHYEKIFRICTCFPSRKIYMLRLLSFRDTNTHWI